MNKFFSVSFSFFHVSVCLARRSQSRNVFAHMRKRDVKGKQFSKRSRVAIKPYNTNERDKNAQRRVVVQKKKKKKKNAKSR